jgi:hypothetical protein
MVVRASTMLLVAGVLAACASFDAADTAADAGASTNDAGATVDGGAGGDGSATTPSDAYAAAVIADQPLAFWRLGEKTGAVTMQSAVGSHLLVPTNQPTLGAEGLFGGAGRAVAFDGVKGRCLVASGAPNLMENGRAFAIEMWLFLGAPSDVSYRHLASQSDGSRELSVFVREGRLGFDLYDRGALTEIYRTEPATLQWHHVVMQAASMRVPRLWVDGAEVSNESTSLATAGTQHTLVFGAESDGAASLPVGSRLAEIAVYDHVLAADRVLSHFTLGRAP